MLGAIKRVISGENIDEESQQRKQQQQQQQRESQHPLTVFSFSSTGGCDDMIVDAPALVENDEIMEHENNNNNILKSGNTDDADHSMMDVDQEGDHHGGGDDPQEPIVTHVVDSNDGNSTTGSSISDVSAKELHQPNNPDSAAAVSLPPRPLHSTAETSSSSGRNSPMGTKFLTSRSSGHGGSGSGGNDGDSFSSAGRASSQNSSRDWGWFEDVHTTGSLEAATPPPRSGKISTGGAGGVTTSNPPPMGGNFPVAGTFAQTGGGQKKQPQSTTRNSTTTTPNTKSKGGLIPNIGLMMESPNSGWDDDYFNPESHELLEPILMSGTSRDMEDEAAVQAVTAPNYVLEESLSSQKLWKDTAGNRPPQPLEERAFFEQMWAQNFARSQVEYEMPVEVLTATTPISLSPFADGIFDGAHHHQPEMISHYNIGVPTSDMHASGMGGGAGTDAVEATLVSRLNDPRGQHHVNAPLFAPGIMAGAEPYEIINRKVKGSTSAEDLTVLIKGDNVFGTTVSKSFARPGVNGGPIAGVDTVNISVACYRVVDSKRHGKYAQFLVIYREGSIRDTIGVWKRYSDFQELSRKVTKAHEGCAAVIANMSPLAVTEEDDVEHLPNAITSWRLLKKRQRWYRCLDAGYLSLKVFLLERFLHDILFESSTPTLLRDFVGVPPPKS